MVEGYLDLAAVVQAGFENVVASLGTAFTPAQARRLARYTNRVVVSYDGDAAGAAATARSLDLLLERGFDVRVVDLPAGVDPDDFIRKEGAEAYGTLLREAPEYLEFLVRREARIAGPRSHRREDRRGQRGPPTHLQADQLRSSGHPGRDASPTRCTSRTAW